MKIILENMEFYAFHGVYTEERTIGNRFMVDLMLEADLSKAAESDNVADTINYETVYALTAEQMRRPSDLLEHLAKRIADALTAAFPLLERTTVRVTKFNPPLGGQVERVTVEYTD